MKPKQYVLKGKIPVPEPYLWRWGEWFSRSDRHVKRECIGDIMVSTIFLGLDHQFDEGPPILWETMTFYEGAAVNRITCDRCSGSWEDAEAMHERVAARVRAGEILPWS